jgi:Asp-tRNA(Asn)/Glu-tRNA(Gln) amidotransferase A subunit family amidase
VLMCMNSDIKRSSGLCGRVGLGETIWSFLAAGQVRRNVRNALRGLKVMSNEEPKATEPESLPVDLPGTSMTIWISKFICLPSRPSVRSLATSPHVFELG